MSVVSNTGPLIALAKVDQLHLRERLFGQVYIPPAVHRELLAKSGLEAARLDEALSSFIQVKERPMFPAEVEALTNSLDVGEQEAVALAQQLSLPLVMDDRLGREAAQRLNVAVTGCVGVLIRAKQDSRVSSVRALLEQMRAQGYWLSDELIAAAASQAGEPGPLPNG